MTFMNIENAENLFENFDRCVGDVDLIAPDGTTYDWKTYGGAMRALLAQTKHIDRLDVRVRNSVDQKRMLRLMMERAG
jgi:hypothetical protein